MRRAKCFFTRSVETVTAHVNSVSGTLVEAGYENKMFEERVNVTCDPYTRFSYQNFLSFCHFPLLENLENSIFFVAIPLLSFQHLIIIIFIKTLGKKKVVNILTNNYERRQSKLSCNNLIANLRDSIRIISQVTLDRDRDLRFGFPLIVNPAFIPLLAPRATSSRGLLFIFPERLCRRNAMRA